jgi:hypothetical protein
MGKLHWAGFFSQSDILREEEPFTNTSFSVGPVERAACSFGARIKPHQQAGSMFY